MQDMMKEEWFLKHLPPETSKMNELCLEQANHFSTNDPQDGQIRLMLQEAMEKQTRYLESISQEDDPDGMIRVTPGFY